MMVLQEKNGTDIKYDEAAMKRVVRIRWIELGVYNKILSLGSTLMRDYWLIRQDCGFIE